MKKSRVEGVARGWRGARTGASRRRVSETEAGDSSGIRPAPESAVHEVSSGGRSRGVDGIAEHYSETRICSFVSSLYMRRGVCASFYRLKSKLPITVQIIFFFFFFFFFVRD